MSMRRSSRRENFTKKYLESLPPAEPGTTDTYHDSGADVRGLQVRVTPSGHKTFYVLKRLAGSGAPERVKIGVFPEVTVDQARKAALKIVNEMAQGNSPMAEKRASRVKTTRGHTLAQAIDTYVERKRRTIKDENGREQVVELKDRTKTQLRKLVEAPRPKIKGQGMTQPGELYDLANKPINAITADDLRTLHAKLELRSKRRAGTALAALRTVLKGFGVVIKDDPFGDAVPELDRLHLAKSGVSDSVIDESQIGRWWNTVNDMEPSRWINYLKFLALTGCRPSEPLTVLVKDCDLENGVVVLHDTKNRKNHYLILATQTWEIVKIQAAGKKPDERLFGFSDAKQVIYEVKRESGIPFSAKTLRATFATLADELVSAGTLKRMMNHSQAGDVTQTHYIRKNREQLRRGWQTVADFIEEKAAIEKAGNVTVLPAVESA